MKKTKQSQMSLYFTFLIAAIVIVVLTALIAPFGVKFGTEMYSIGEGLILEANDTLNNIDNATVRNSLRSSMEGGLDAAEDNINVNTSVFRYSWLIMLVLIALIIFIYTRKMVEVQGGGLA